MIWHDAKAYCIWLTDRWRASRTIGSKERVRLLTEPERERAVNGDINRFCNLISATGIDLVYPWGATWLSNVVNSEEIGLNNTCTVGLFPSG